MTRTIEQYYAEGCGRCKLSLSPNCKAKRQIQGIDQLRQIILSLGVLEESIKWGNPCYTFQGKIICIIGAFKEFFSLNFFKGALIQDSFSVLTTQGENANSSRIIRFDQEEQVEKLSKEIIDCLNQAIEIEKSGKKIAPKRVEDIPFPQELKDKFEEHEGLENAFNKLSPGRQKAYLYFFNQTKNPETRYRRIEKFLNHIFQGKGPQE